MSKSFEFFFDYASPTAYLATKLAPEVAERTGAELIYRPMFLGGVMQATGNRPPGMVPAKGKYLGADLTRIAKHIGMPLHFNPYFPVNTLGLLRATVGLQERDTGEFHRFMAACWTHSWAQPELKNLGEPSEIAAMCVAEGFDPEDIAALATDEANKDKLKANTQEAIDRGVFGAPSFFVGEELFFGQDRLDYVERAL